MATLSAHGTNKRIKFLYSEKAFCSDGTILRKHFTGPWKLLATATPESIEGIYQKAVTFQAKVRRERPAWTAYADCVSQYSMKDRELILIALTLSGSDIDGAWADLTDVGHVEVTFEDVLEIYKLRQAAQAEAELDAIKKTASN